MTEQLFFDAILVYITSRILTKEAISDIVREFLLNKNFFFLHELFSCPFCMSFWIASFFCIWMPSVLWIGYRITFSMLFVSIIDRLERIK